VQFQAGCAQRASQLTTVLAVDITPSVEVGVIALVLVVLVFEVLILVEVVENVVDDTILVDVIESARGNTLVVVMTGDVTVVLARVDVTVTNTTD
jgi:hypothetical protein